MEESGRRRKKGGCCICFCICVNPEALLRLLVAAVVEVVRLCVARSQKGREIPVLAVCTNWMEAAFLPVVWGR